MVLLGMVPVLMQAPPITSRLFDQGDALAGLGAWMAARWPAGPEPMTMRSNFSITGEALREASLFPQKAAQVYHRAQHCLAGPPFLHQNNFWLAKIELLIRLGAWGLGDNGLSFRGIQAGAFR